MSNTLCEKCEAVSASSQCCNQNFCHLCILKHVCVNSNTQVNQSLLNEVCDSYKQKNDTLIKLCEMLRGESKGLKDENVRLYEENQGLMLQINELKQDIACRQPNLDVIETNLLPPSIHSSQTASTQTAPAVSSAARRSTLKKSVISKK